ncbi:MAG: cytochrome c oxidase subunit II transmembrane domain-containing protein, partial [candidate division WOR-3 bacterium]
MRNFPLFPEQASTFAVAIDQIALVLTLLATFFFLLVGSIAVIFIWRYRRGSGASRAGAHDHHLGLELTWTLIPLAMALAMFFWAAKVYAEVYGPPPKEALEIFVMGKQWMWHLQHPNGIRENNTLHIPAGRPVKLAMISMPASPNWRMCSMRCGSASPSRRGLSIPRIMYTWRHPA